MPISFNATKCKLYAMLFFILIFAYIVYIVSVSLRSSGDGEKGGVNVEEHFTSEQPSNLSAPDYSVRMTVMDVFDAYMHRNPTPEEIQKYSAFKNEQDILQEVMKDFPNPDAASTKVKKALATREDEPALTLTEDVPDSVDIIKSVVKAEHYVDSEEAHVRSPVMKLPRHKVAELKKHVDAISQLVDEALMLA